MDKSVKQEWVEALRSGEYEQATGVLRRQTDDGIKHCCLGVLCDIVKDRVNGCWSDVNFESVDFRFDVEGEKSCIEILPKAIVTKFDLPSPEVEIDGTTLTSLNDGIGCDQHSFDEIADVIEQNL